MIALKNGIWFSLTAIVSVCYCQNHPRMRVGTLTDEFGDSNVVVINFNGTASLSTNLSVGTPPQKVTVRLAPRSDLILGGKPLSCDESCDSYFNSSLSSTWVVNFTNSNSNFGGQHLLFGTDNISFGPYNIPDAEFGYANQLAASTYDDNLGVPVNEIGLEPLGGEESVVAYTNGRWIGSYPNLPYLLNDRGRASSVSWSLRVYNDEESSSWSAEQTRNAKVAFGALDTQEYVGEFSLVPIVRTFSSLTTPKYNFYPQDAPPQSLNVMLHGVSVKSEINMPPSLVGNLSLPARINYGVGLTLPEPIVDALMHQIGAVGSLFLGSWMVPCDTKASLQLDLSGIVVDVPLRKLLYPLALPDSPKPSTYGPEFGPWEQAVDDLNSTNVCKVSFLSPGTPPSIGLETLESLYTVVDLNNFEIAFAEINRSPAQDGRPEWETIDSSGIPSATQAPKYSSTNFIKPYGVVDTTAAPVITVGASESSYMTIAETIEQDLEDYPSSIPSGPLLTLSPDNSAAPTTSLARVSSLSSGQARSSAPSSNAAIPSKHSSAFLCLLLLEIL